MPEEKLKLKTYQRMLHYDPSLGGDAVVFIGFTGRGSFSIRALIAPEGRRRREQKNEMLARLADAIEAGQEPGEVSMDTPRPERLNDTFDPEEW